MATKLKTESKCDENISQEKNRQILVKFSRKQDYFRISHTKENTDLYIRKNLHGSFIFQSCCSLCGHKLFKLAVVILQLKDCSWTYSINLAQILHACYIALLPIWMSVGCLLHVARRLDYIQMVSGCFRNNMVIYISQVFCRIKRNIVRKNHCKHSTC
jgi:hypothetical protein